MKIKLHLLSITLALLAGVQMVAAQGTAFTYQGQLTTGSGPANGYYDVTFKLWTASSGGAQVGSTQTFPATVISNGLFTVTSLDFGSVFNGTPFWLELAVRSNGVPPYQTLLPRQPLTPTPYAITAENVDGLVPASQLSGAIPSGALAGVYPSTVDLSNPANIIDGTFSGDGSGLTGVNASQLNGHNANFFWQRTGNAGTTPGLDFVGTTDNKALEVHVNGQRALRVEPDSSGNTTPNVIGGSQNSVMNGLFGATIGGGGGSLGPNSVTNDFGTIAGGVGNLSGNQAAVGGGYLNTAGALNATVGGGFDNSATAEESTVPGGYGNVAAGVDSFAAGTSATANNSGSFVWSDDAGFPTADTGANQFVVRATGGAFFYDGATGVVIDSSGSNFGTIDFGIKFGLASGEGIASQRTTGANQYDLNFYTSFADRMTIMNNGFVGINTTSPGGQLDVESSAAFNGINVNNSYGNGNGIYSEADNGGGAYAIEGYSTGGYALYGSSGSGTAVYGASSTGSALTIGSGAIHVSGASTNNASTAAFIQVATAANTSSYITTINNSLCNGDPHAILLVTHNFNPVGVGGNYEAHPFSVYYNGSHWTIYNDDFVSILDMSFNVLVIKN